MEAVTLHKAFTLSLRQLPGRLSYRSNLVFNYQQHFAMKKLLFIILAAAGLLTTGCKKFLDVNKDPNNPTDVQEALLLSPIEQNISDNVQGGNASIVVQNYLQNIAPNQPNPGLWNYQSFNVDFDGDWNNIYVVCLNNLKVLNEKAEGKE